MYKIQEGFPHFVTFTLVGWVDLFTRARYANIIIESLAFCQQHKGLLVHAYVIMPSHLHLLISQREENLAGLIRDFKQFTSRRLFRALYQDGESRQEWLIPLFKDAALPHKKIKHAKLWQRGNYPKYCYSKPFTQQKLNYIHNNPVKARIVREAHHYVWSSAQDYMGLRGLLEVSLLR